MKTNAEPTKATKQYLAAYTAHYTAMDLRKAIELYKGVLASHPNTVEAGYAQSQIDNIVNTVVPKQELLDAQVAFAWSRLLMV